MKKQYIEKLRNTCKSWKWKSELSAGIPKDSFLCEFYFRTSVFRDLFSPKVAVRKKKV